MKLPSIDSKPIYIEVLFENALIPNIFLLTINNIIWLRNSAFTVILHNNTYWLIYTKENKNDQYNHKKYN